MPLPITRTRHRLQLGAAILASIGSVWVVSRVVHRFTAPKPVAAPAYVYVPAVAPPKALVQPAPYVPQVPHLTAAFASALAEGDLKTLNATYTDESSLGIALKTSARYGKRDVVAWVLDKGADPHFGELEQDAPLLAADEHPDVVKLLLDRGTEEPDLATAAIVGAPNAVTRILAKRKGAVNPVDGSTPLYDAVSSAVATPENRRLIVDKLLAAGADVNVGEADRTPLGAAIATCAFPDDESCLELTHLLISRKARVSSDALSTALDLEEGAGRAKLMDALLAGKIEPGATAAAISHANGEHDGALIKKIAGKGISWSFHDGEPDAAAPLVEAVEKQDVALVRAFLDAGAPADFHFKDGRCAFGQAIDAASSSTNEAERIVELLLAHGANANRRLPDGRPPLFAAAETGDVRVVNAILAAGARVNERVLDETALDAAERSGHVPVARVLDGHGARRAPPRPDTP